MLMGVILPLEPKQASRPWRILTRVSRGLLSVALTDRRALLYRLGVMARVEE